MAHLLLPVCARHKKSEPSGSLLISRFATYFLAAKRAAASSQLTTSQKALM
jgi:hypothetical protein